ncbi:MAG: hypothetical protein U0401_01655 [Anaerolineae bacterium]
MANRFFYCVITILIVMTLFTGQRETLAKNNPESEAMSRLRMAAPGVIKATSVPNGSFGDATASIPEVAPVGAFVTFRGFVTTVEAPDSSCTENYSTGVRVAVIINNAFGALTGKTDLRIHYTYSHNFPVGSAVEVYGAMILGSGACSGSAGVVIVEEGVGSYITPSVIYSAYLPIVAAGGSSQASLPDSAQSYFSTWAISRKVWSR